MYLCLFHLLLVTNLFGSSEPNYISKKIVDEESNLTLLLTQQPNNPDILFRLGQIYRYEWPCHSDVVDISIHSYTYSWCQNQTFNLYLKARNSIANEHMKYSFDYSGKFLSFASLMNHIVKSEIHIYTNIHYIRYAK